MREGVLEIEQLGEDPVAALRSWHREALDCGMNEPSGMTVASVDGEGCPDARVVLLKGIEDDGSLVFFTNYEGAKGQQLTAHPLAAAVLWWDPMRRQIRARGPVERVSADSSDAYHDSRPRGSQLSAWASAQSRPAHDRQALEAAFSAQEERFGEGPVPRPEYWGGFRLIPRTIEFWQHQDDRLHDRFLYTRGPGGWSVQRLQP